MKPLTVVQLVPAMHSGGVERGTLEVASELSRRHHRSIVISAPGALVSALTAAGSEHIPWPIGRKSPASLLFVSKLRRLLRDERADIVHARSRVPAWIGFLAVRSMSGRSRPFFITTVHASHSVSPYSAIMTRGDIVIAVSETIRQYITRNYPKTDPKRIRLIYRGVDPAEFPPGHRPSDAWREAFAGAFPAACGSPLLTLPGRLGHRKGHLDFLTILRGVRERGIQCHGLIVGEITGRSARPAAALRRAIDDAGLRDHVTLTGLRSDMADIHAASAIVYCLSGGPGESFGRTVAEALTIGTPVIGYDAGGTGEILTRLLPEGRVRPGDTSAAIELTARFLNNPPRPLPNTYFLRQTMLDATLDLYEECCAGGG